LHPHPEDNAIAAMHLNVERALEASGIEATFLRPGGFDSNALGWAQAVKTAGAVDLPYPNGELSVIHEADIADAALAVLTTPALRGKAYRLTGPESLTGAEQVAVIGKAADRPIAVNHVGPEEWKASVSGFLPPALADALLALAAETDGRPDTVTDAVEELTGHPARTFAEWADENADAFRP
ncbi:NmrA family NAD(P)-binding protein, partial [Streptomyces sp. NPDC049577]|uniref:NmrA family NAD(P)-binding protein n=1 Tax=Streptomyces sp. NPDC049577 TaxID=3155153 RepID=UPI00341CB50F